MLVGFDVPDPVMRTGQGVQHAPKGMQKAHRGNQHSRDFHHSGRGGVCGGPWRGQAEDLQPRHWHGNPLRRCDLQVIYRVTLLESRPSADKPLHADAKDTQAYAC